MTHPHCWSINTEVQTWVTHARFILAKVKGRRCRVIYARNHQYLAEPCVHRHVVSPPRVSREVARVGLHEGQCHGAVYRPWENELTRTILKGWTVEGFTQCNIALCYYDTVLELKQHGLNIK